MTLTRSSLALSLAAVLVACGSETADAGTPPSQNVVQLAQGNPDLSILVEAVVAADLAGTLSAPGPRPLHSLRPDQPQLRGPPHRARREQGGAPLQQAAPHRGAPLPRALRQ